MGIVTSVACFANEVSSEMEVHFAVESGQDMNEDKYSAAIGDLKEHGGVAIEYLRRQRVIEFKKLKM
jgi:hypothetical protein